MNRLDRKITYIRWRDARYDTEECAIADLDLADLDEIGHVLAEDDEVVKVGVERQEGAQTARLWVNVPRVNIIEMYTTTIREAFRIGEPEKKRRRK